MTSDAPDQPGTDDRRAQQIAAVRDYLEGIGWDLAYEDALAGLVDAVMVAGGLEPYLPLIAESAIDELADYVSPLTGTVTAADRELVANATDGRITSRELQPEYDGADGQYMTPAEPRDALARAEAAGYAQAVAALRDTPGYERWVDTANDGEWVWDNRARRQLARYLEAVGPGTQPTDPPPAVVALPLKDQKLTGENTGTGRAWVFSLDAKPDVLFADGTHRYWSTHCRHGNHDACSATELVGQMPTVPEISTAILRKPAQCRTCSAPCICPCHTEVPTQKENTPNGQ